MNNRIIEYLTFRDLITSMVENINRIGTSKAWDIINQSLIGKTRVMYIEVYLSALELINNEGELGDNFPYFGGSDSSEDY